MKRGAVLILFLFVILFSSFVYAADVAYILASERAVKAEILSVFSSLNLSVQLIRDSNVRSVNLNNYKLIFVDDVRLRNTKNIPIYNYPSVIMNKYYGKEWGLTDADGISQLASTAPLQVRLVNNGVKQVYTQAKEGSVNIPYYFLDDENKANLISIARTYTGNSYNFGDVVATAQSGTHLINGKISGGKICFYGIAKTKYWTNNARNLFIDCVNSVLVACSTNSDCDDNDGYTQDVCVNPGTIESFCEHNSIECFEDVECGESHPADGTYCSNGDVYRDFVIPKCENQGTPQSFCDENSEAELIEECTYGCENGECLEPECIFDLECGDDYYSDNYCSNDDVYHDLHDFGCENNNCEEDIVPELIQDCVDGCANGSCLDIECYNNSECDDSNIQTEDVCINPGTPQSFCEHNPIACLSNSDCGLDGFIGSLFCNGPFNDDVFQNFRNWTCENPGSVSSSCSLTITQLLVNECADSCVGGGCIDIVCNNDKECDDDNNETLDFCNNPGTIESSCSHEGFLCSQNSDCGTDRYTGGLYCVGDDIHRDFLNFNCNNPRTNNAFCNSNTNSELLFECDYACANGFCVRCNENSDCDDGSEDTQDTCWFSGTIDAYCTHEHIECFEDLDCGEDSFIDGLFCSNGDVYQNYREFSCVNQGTPGSYCNAGINPINIQNCSFGCSNGSCLPGVHDVALTENYDGFGHIIKLRNPNDDVIEENVPVLQCNLSYDIQFRTENIGNFVEDVDINVSILNSTDIIYNDIKTKTDLGVGATTTTGNKNNFLINFAKGIYNIMVQAIISIDNNPGNNFASRGIEVICPECFVDADCGNTSLINNYCVGNNVTSNYSVPTCLSGECEVGYEQVFNETCEFGCENGGCLPQPECISDLECGDDYYSDNYCSGNNLVRDFHNFSCVQQSCVEINSTEIIQSGDELVTDYTSLRLQHGLANINIQNSGYLIFKSPVHDDLMIRLQKQGGGSQIIYFHDMWNVYPGICGGNDDLCIYNRTGSLLYKTNLLFGNINRTRVDVLAGENLSLEIEADPLWDVGLEIWAPVC